MLPVGVGSSLCAQALEIGYEQERDSCKFVCLNDQFCEEDQAGGRKNSKGQKVTVKRNAMDEEDVKQAKSRFVQLMLLPDIYDSGLQLCCTTHCTLGTLTASCHQSTLHPAPSTLHPAPSTLHIDFQLQEQPTISPSAPILNGAYTTATVCIQSF